MTARRPTPWFLTQPGRAFSFYGSFGAAVGLTCINYFPHSFFLDKYKEFVQNYSNGKEAPLNQDLSEKYQQCLELLKVSDKHKKLLTPFSVFGFDLFHAGSCTTKYGAVVGIPTHFSFKTKDDIDNDQLLVNQKKVNWDSEAGKKLADSLILPDNVQKFAICREILSTQNFKVYLDAVYPMVCVSLAFGAGQAVNKKYNLYATTRSVRGVLYILLGTFATGLYFFLKDYTQVFYETQVDKRLCELGPEFIENGVVFYDKLLQRNQALRQLMGSEGESKYTKLGNENYLLRQPRIALVHRKNFFESQLKEKNENENAS